MWRDLGEKQMMGAIEVREPCSWQKEKRERSTQGYTQEECNPEAVGLENRRS